MSQIKSKNSKPEMIVRKFLHSQGFRYSLYNSKFPGKPDVVLSKYKTIVFINGCFWHCHEGCRYYRLPKSNLDYRKPKLKRNYENDQKNLILLKDMGRNIIVVWECELKKDKVTQTLQSIKENILEKLPKD